MAAIRRIVIGNFRGYENWSVCPRAHAVVLGEPGAGRSDLVEGIVRVLDNEYLRSRRPSELDVFGLDTTRTASVELVIGDLSPAAAAGLFDKLEFWDADAEQLLTAFAAGVTPGAQQEQIVRLTYALSFDGSQPLERVYYPKLADPQRQLYPRASQVERSLLPFFWQRGLTTKPLDLTGRGEFRELVDLQPGEEFDLAVGRFVAAVGTAAAAFSSQDRVSAALTAILQPLRGVRRFDPTSPAEDLVRFLPDGGAPSGLLRTLGPAVTLAGTPAHLPATRQGSSLLAALRGGLLVAAAAANPGAIVVIDDLGGEFDPFLARHLAATLRRSSAQLIATTHAPEVALAFATDELIRLYHPPTGRAAARGKRPASKPERISVRYLTSSLTQALNASAVVVLEGYHDRLGYQALAERLVELGLLESFEAAGIAFVEAEGNGEVAKVARAAKDLGIFTVAVLDNDTGAPAATDAEVQAGLANADAVLRLPARMAVERALLEGVPDAELVRVFRVLEAALPDLALPAGWQAKTGGDLQGILRGALKRPGGLHAFYVEELSAASLPAHAVRVLQEALRIARARAAGLVEM